MLVTGLDEQRLQACDEESLLNPSRGVQENVTQPAEQFKVDVDKSPICLHHEAQAIMKPPRNGTGELALL
jgi:hypothetical protein